MSSTLNSINN